MLVTGGAGFIGSHLVRKLIQSRNIQVTVVDNLSNNRQYFTTRPYANEERVSFFDMDIRNMEGVNDVIFNKKIDTCFHLAAKISVAESMLSPFNTIDVNVNGTTSLLNACAQNGVENFVFASSAAVYGEPKTVPVSEDHVLSPLSPYGASKVAGESLVTSFANSGRIKNAVSLRFFNVYGKGQSSDYAGVITKFIERIGRGLAPVIYGDGQQTRDFVSVHDIVDGLVIAAEEGCSGIYNLGTGISITLNELASTVLKSLGSTLQPIHEKGRNGDIRDSRANIELILKELEFKPSIPVRQGVSALAQDTAAIQLMLPR
ncbi:MAG: NAD-dependent epimerase/dehydratase family protein [Nitrososphaera sp.]